MSETNKEENQLVEVVSDNQLSTELSSDLLGSFGGLIDEAKKIVLDSKKIIITNDSQVDNMKQARKNRLALVNIRGRTEKIRVSGKAHIVREGKAIDGASNIIKALTIPEEKELLEKENYVVNKKKKALEELEQKRSAELEAVEFDPSSFNLQIMSEETYQQQLKMATDYFNKLKLEEKEEEEAKVKRDARALLNNSRKIEIAEYKDYFQGTNYDEATDILADKSEDEFAKLKTSLIRLKAEYLKKQKKIEDDNKKLKAEKIGKEKLNNAKLKKAQDKAKIAQKALDDKKEEERKAEEAKEAEEKALADAERKKQLAPDKEKLNKLAVDITSMKMPEVKDKKAEEIIKQVVKLLNKTSSYIKANAVKL